ncbi:MAG: cytochrome P450 [Kutzneria sp.]|nr:cytochrome P450 [Kutzneria sp.]MBV9846973.1 cytochrome P450 [Kutzneria sp.]
MTAVPADSGPIAGADVRSPDRVPVAMYGPEFAANPAHFYEKLRQYGPVAPVELAPGVPAMLVVGYEAALEVMRSPETFPKDPRRWQATVPSDCPVLPMMGYRPIASRVDGAELRRYRSVIVDAFSAVDLVSFRAYLEHTADELVGRMAPNGWADLIAEYVMAMLFRAVTYLFGCSTDSAVRLVKACTALTDAGQDDAEKANQEFTTCLLELAVEKRARPGNDVTSRMVAHSAMLTDEEMVHQLAVLVFTTLEPERVVIGNTLALLLSDERFAGSLSGGSLPVEDAIDEVLWTDSGCDIGISYPRQDLDFHGARLPADQPVVISFAAANNDPSLPRDHSGNRAHITWGAGPHACPVPVLARLIASVAIERLLDGLPDMRLAIPANQLTRRVGPFYHTLTAIPVQFPPVPRPSVRPPKRPGYQDENSSIPPTVTTTTRHRTRGWRNFAARWWDGQ